MCFSYQEGILFKCSDRGLRKTILPHGDKFLTRLKADKREESKEIRAMTEKPKPLEACWGLSSNIAFLTSSLARFSPHS